MNIITKQKIEKGWSGDLKYCVTDEKGDKFLLRVSNIEQYERKKSEFEYMKQVAALGVPMCKPLEFGICDEGVYSVQTWIDGTDAEENIKNFSDTQQYLYGFEAGKILKKIHSIPAPANAEDWEIRFNRKIDRKIKMYEDCPLKYENSDAILDYISTHRHLLKSRPQTYQHGDYHIGNMMIGTDKKLYIIDFNRNDFGDPWEEFNRIVWCAQAAPLFASGMVDGYFENCVPPEFWSLLALYIASNTLSSLPWAIPFGEKEIEVMKNQAREVLTWYDNMKNPVPMWYVSDYPGIQPEIIVIENGLRLKKFDGNIERMLAGYQDPIVYQNSEGIFDKTKIPNRDYISGMCKYLENAGEFYFIEIIENGEYIPIGDVTVKAENPPIAIWQEKYRGIGIPQESRTHQGF